MRIPLSALPPSLRVQAEQQLGLATRPASPHTPTETPQKRPHKPSASPAPTTTPPPPAKPSTTRQTTHKCELAPYHTPASRSAPPIRDSHADSAMTKTERAYLSQVLHNQARFEPVTFRLLGNCRYTPDFLSVDDGILTFHEVKGSYRLESEGRAWTAFNEAAAQFPFFRWIWAVKNKPSKSNPAPDPWTVKALVEPQNLPSLPTPQGA